jgi:hypothetical protein
MKSPQPIAYTYDERLASLRAAGDVELAITLMAFSRNYERICGERCAPAEAAAERLMSRPTPPPDGQ